MTSNVKGCSQLFMSSSQVPISSRWPSEEAEPVRHDGGSRGYPWVGDHLTGSVGCLPSGRGACRSLHAVEGDTIPGPRPFRWAALLRCARTIWAFEGDHGDLLGHGPHKGDQCPGDGHHDLMGVCPACAQRSVACAEPYLCLPAISCTAVGRFSRRRCRWRLTFAGSRYAQAPSTSARRAWVFPVLVIEP